MKRREAIRNILIASAGTVFITGCSEADAIEFLIDGKLNLNKNHLEYLNSISGAFLPREDLTNSLETPAEFIQTMLNEVRPPEDVQKFTIGFDQYKLLMKESRLKIKSSDPKEVIAVIEEALKSTEPQEEMIFFINSTKEEAIHHFLTSEYYLTEHQKYKLIPDPFEGCIDV